MNKKIVSYVIVDMIICCILWGLMRIFPFEDSSVLLFLCTAFIVAELIVSSRFMKGMKTIEYIVACFISIFFVIVELLFVVISVMAANSDKKLIILEVILFVSLIPIIWVKFLSMQKITPDDVKNFLYVIVVVAIILVITPENSTIVSAIVAVPLLLLTSEVLGAVYNVEVSNVRKKELLRIRFYITLFVPISYILNKGIQIFLCNEGIQDFLKEYMISTTLLKIIIVFIMFVILIFLGVIEYLLRPKVQVYLGLSEKQRFLNGNWRKVTVNPHTQKEIIVRKLMVHIDGTRVNYQDRVLRVDEELRVFDENDKGIGIVIKKDNDEMILQISKAEPIKLIKIGTEKYNRFNGAEQFPSKRFWHRKHFKFYNIKIKDELIDYEIPVTLFGNIENEEYCIEANSRTKYKYDLKDIVERWPLEISETFN